MSGKLVIHRKKSLNGLLINTDVFINNKLVGQLKNGEQKEFELPEGSHIIRITQSGKNGEQKITIKKNELISYSFQPTLWSLVSFICPIIAVSLFYFYKISMLLTILIMLPGVLLAMYHISIGKNNYFVFKAK